MEKYILNKKTNEIHLDKVSNCPNAPSNNDKLDLGYCSSPTEAIIKAECFGHKDSKCCICCAFTLKPN